MKRAVIIIAAASFAQAADLPVRRVVVYKNGVAYYERSGAVRAGEAARLDFKIAEMDDVLKSLVLEAPGGVARVRYELNEPLQRKLLEHGIQFGPQMALAVMLDQWRGARIEMKYRDGRLSGTVLSGRLAAAPNQGQKQELALLLDGGELALVDLDAATNIRLADARLQGQLSDALAAIAQSRSKDRRAVFIDLTGASEQRVTARYLAPAPVWKSAYRLLLPDAGEPVLEGWAIVDNATGEDWNSVSLTVVSGRPVSFISRLYEARYVQRAEAVLPDDQPAAPELHEGGLLDKERKNEAGASRAKSVGDFARQRLMAAAEAPAPPPMMMSAVTPGTLAREAGELFEYQFSRPVNAKKGESLLLPFFQGRIEARKLLIYSDRSQPNPRNAAELHNTSGKTLDGGPVTVYHSSGYSGEALMDILKEGEKRLISYAVDQGTRVTTNFDSGSEVIRSLKANRGVLITRTTVEQKTTYTVTNADAKEKTLVIEHAVTAGQKLLSPKADERTPNHYRFSMKLPGKGGGKLAVVEEREIENSIMVSSLTPGVILTFTRNKALPEDARGQLEGILARKRDIAAAENEQRRIEEEIREIGVEQDRVRQNINTLRNVAGQQEQVNRYAAELAKGDVRMAQLRDSLSQLRKSRAALEAGLNALIEKLAF